MKIDPLLPLNELAQSHATARILERYRLDYCCGGKRTLAAACEAAGQEWQLVAAELDQALAAPDAANNPGHGSLDELIRFIVETHHAFTRTELQRIDSLLRKVIGHHGEAHPELRSVSACFDALQADLVPHLMKEEQILFPYIRDLERHRRGELQSPPTACFGAIDHPIRQMEAEHQTVGDLLQKIRRLTGDFAVPADACPTYRNTYQALAGLEVDLTRHIHLENNVLFSRARTLGATGN